MDVKTYLEKIQKLDTEINVKWEELQRLQSMRMKMTTVFSMTPVASSGSQSKLEDLSIRIIEIQENLNRMTDRFVDLSLEATSLIDQLQNSDHRRVLHKIYLEYKKICEVAAELGVSNRTIYNWQKDAIAALNALRKRKVDGGKG